MSAHDPRPYISHPSNSRSSSSAPHSGSKMGIEFCSITLYACVAGWWEPLDAPLEKHCTHRSYSLQSGWAHLIRTWESHVRIPPQQMESIPWGGNGGGDRWGIAPTDCRPGRRGDAAGRVAIATAVRSGSEKLVERLTVDVISAEHESQTYLTPPSPPLVAVFFRMTPIAPVRRNTRGHGQQ